MKNSLYFAYGSNLNLDQMARRCPGARVIGPATLRNHQLIFRGYPGRSFATVEPLAGAFVPGLIWSLTQADEFSLDRYEGFPNMYRKELVAVHQDAIGPVLVMAYLMNPGSPIAAPGEGYLKAIAQGYAAAGFNLDDLYRSCR